MSSAMKSLVFLLIGVFLALGWCACCPQNDTGSALNESHLDSSRVRPEERSPAAADLSAPNDVSVFSGKARDPNDDDVCVVETMLDINSGDLRRTRLVSDGVPQYEIYESELSKEVRRLDITIPEERQWKTIAVPPPSAGGMRIQYVYMNVFRVTHMMLRLFDEVNALDEERRTTLQRFMTSLRTEKPLTALRKGDVLILEMCDRHGLDSPFAARYTEALRRYR